MGRKRFFFLLSCSLLSACASQPPVHMPLPDAARSGMTSTDVVLPIQQSEIYVFVPASNVSAAAGGGLLAALVDAGIDSVRNSKAETAVAPLRNAMVDFSFDEALEQELRGSLSQIGWMHIGAVSAVRDVTNDNLDRALSESHANVLLFIVPDYHLSNDGDVLIVTAAARLIPNDDALRALRSGKHDDKNLSAPINALYRNAFTFEARISATGDRDRNIAIWDANKGSDMRAALNMAAQKIAIMLANDLQRPAVEVDPAADAQQVKVNVADEAGTCTSSQAECGTYGTLIGKDADGETLGFKDGSLKYVKQVVFQ